jgi:uncharacterized protein YrrD
MKRMQNLKKMLVLTIQEGKNLGRVRDLIVDPVTVQVVALILDQRTSKGEVQVVATANVNSIGQAAITVEDSGSLVPISRIPRFQELAQGKTPMQGKLVITEGGDRLGHIADLLVDPETFRIEAFQLRRVFGKGKCIPSERIRTIGPDAVVVREEQLVAVEPVRPAPKPVRPAAPAAPRPAPVPLVEIEFAEEEPLPPAAVEEIVQAIAEEIEPAVPSISTVDEAAAELPAGLVPMEEHLAGLTDETPPRPEDQPLHLSAEELGEAQPPQNPWQRFVRRLRREEEEEEEKEEEEEEKEETGPEEL